HRRMLLERLDLIVHDAALELVLRVRQIERRQRLLAMLANFVARQILAAAGWTDHIIAFRLRLSVRDAIQFSWRQDSDLAVIFLNTARSESCRHEMRSDQMGIRSVKHY